MWHNNETKHEFVCEFTHFTYANPARRPHCQRICCLRPGIHLTVDYVMHTDDFVFFHKTEPGCLFPSSSPSPSHYRHHITAKSRAVVCSARVRAHREMNWVNYNIESTLLTVVLYRQSVHNQCCV